jgi:hypothetical protein
MEQLEDSLFTVHPEEGRISYSIPGLRKFGENLGFSPEQTNRISLTLLFQLWWAKLEPMRFGSHFDIVAELRYLEGLCPTNTKIEDQFKHLPLKGLWKKHYRRGDLKSFVRNLINEQGPKGKNLLRIIEEEFAAEKSGYFTKELAGRIVHRSVFDFYAQRSQERRMTGEWIFFAEHGERRYYLCVGSHEVADIDHHAFIMRNCGWEFPFLQLQLPSVT